MRFQNRYLLAWALWLAFGKIVAQPASDDDPVACLPTEEAQPAEIEKIGRNHEAMKTYQHIIKDEPPESPIQMHLGNLITDYQAIIEIIREIREIGERGEEPDLEKKQKYGDLVHKILCEQAQLLTLLRQKQNLLRQKQNLLTRPLPMPSDEPNAHTAPLEEPILTGIKEESERSDALTSARSESLQQILPLKLCEDQPATCFGWSKQKKNKESQQKTLEIGAPTNCIKSTPKEIAELLNQQNNP